jgi:hydroxymethylpyrimidine pyrophosphatase-like HAD family hydrolase
MTSAASPADAPFRRRIVFTDFDGTIADRGVVPPAHAEAVRRAQRAGHAVVLATGRAVVNMPPGALDLFDGVICSAGAHVQLGDQVLSRRSFEPDLGRRAERVLTEVGALVALETSEVIRVLPGTLPAIRAFFSRGGEPNEDMERVLGGLVDEPDPLRHGVAKILVWTSPVSTGEIAARIGPGIRALPNSIDDSGRHSGELQMSDVDKADGVRIVAGALDVDLADTVCLGDGMNDVGMLEIAGTAVAVGKTPPTMGRIPDLVVPGPHRDGFATALAQLGIA